MRCFTVIGPSHSGKTTLVKALGELEGGSAESSFSDRLSFRVFNYIGESWGAIDVAGGTDNLGAAGHALAASDSAVLCVPPNPDGAEQAAPYLRLVEEASVPCYLFINRMDTAESRVRDTVAALQAYAGLPIILRQVPIREGESVTGSIDLISERAWEYQKGKPSNLIEIPDGIRDRQLEARSELLEHLADFDDALLEQLIEDRTPASESVFDLVSDMHRKNTFISAYLGVAVRGNGVFRLMKSLRHESSSASDLPGRLGLNGSAGAVGVYADNRRHVGKSLLLRDLKGSLSQGSSLGGGTIGSLNGVDGKPINAALEAGGLAIAVKSDHLAPGKAYSETDSFDLPDWSGGHSPSYRRILTPESDRDDARLSGALAKCADIDPGLTISHDADTGFLVANPQGPMHQRRLCDRLAADFDIKVSERRLSGSYRETCSRKVDKHYRHRKQSGGAGQFADIVFTLRPLARGEGFAFQETVKGGRFQGTTSRPSRPAARRLSRRALSDFGSLISGLRLPTASTTRLTVRISPSRPRVSWGCGRRLERPGRFCFSRSIMSISMYPRRIQGVWSLWFRRSRGRCWDSIRTPRQRVGMSSVRCFRVQCGTSCSSHLAA